MEEHGDLSDVIVGGDFNNDRDASVIYALPGIEHITSGPTHPADHPTKLLDHVLLPAAATGVSVTVPSGDAVGGDLRPPPGDRPLHSRATPNS